MVIKREGVGESVWCKALGWVGVCREADKGVVVVMGSAFFVVVLLRGDCARHRMTPVWNQFMMRLKELRVCGGDSFHSMHDPGS